MVEGKQISIGNVAYCVGLSEKKLFRWYKEVLSGYTDPKIQAEFHSHDVPISPRLASKEETEENVRVKVPILKEENVGRYVCIDEKNIGDDCFTIVLNPETNKIILMANTLRSSDLIDLLTKHISLKSRYAVKCVARDMAANYDWVARQVFPNAYQVADKFHVVRSIIEQVQSCRIRHRQALLLKKRELEEAKKKAPKGSFNSELIKELDDLHKELPNGDTLLQLLQRSKGLLHKMPQEMSSRQTQRAKLLFKHFPDIEEAYRFSTEIRRWYNKEKQKGQIIPPSGQLARDKKEALMEIINHGLGTKNVEVKNICHFVLNHIGHICNYFHEYRTNATAEALNQNLQRFVSINYGARNKDFSSTGSPNSSANPSQLN